MYTFALTDNQQKKLNVWLSEQYKKKIEEQRLSMNESEFNNLTQEGKFPYTGAIGGGETYSFTPTSLGVIVVVEYFGEKIDLTEYEMW